MVLRRAGRPINGSGHCRHLTSALDWHCLGRDDCRDGDRVRAAVIDHRLETIAGPPLAIVTTPNTSSAVLDIGVTEPRTFYAMARTSATSSDTVVANLGASTIGSNGEAGAQILRSQAVGLGGMTHRAQTTSSSIVFQPMSLGWPFGQPLVACGWWTGAVFGAHAYGSVPNAESSVGAGEMNPNPRLRLAAVTSATPIVALAYRGVHDRAARTRIMAWLMQRY